MTSLTDLAAQPETFYMIVEYLSSNDLVRMHGMEKLFFQHTKNLVLDGLIRLKYAKKTDIGKIFCQVFQSGELCPRTLAVAIDDLPEGNGGYTDYDGGYGSEKRLKLLDCLKEYGKGKNLREFSVSIRASCWRQLPVYFNLSQVTQLDLNPDYSGIRRNWKAGKANKRTDRQIEELTTILNQTPNLEQLIIGDWLRGQDQFRLSTRPRVKKEWKRLQRAVKNLQSLKTLKAVTYLFHPPFFLIPPPSVTNLLYTRTISPVWWRSFADCEGLGNVRHLTIQVTDSQLLPGSTLERGSEAPQIRDINLGTLQSPDCKNSMPSGVITTRRCISGMGTRRGHPAQTAAIFRQTWKIASFERTMVFRRSACLDSSHSGG
ncbi:hypothetical protein TWF703_005479 [Orbilia oligospora]|uniref:Uncharacterized protein n=1 Tax=Orbilia oligospora TaxID=2813651 RepID=A0A7C8JWM2_ORBOL|nr:hypothetical protein TWF703_005479 [Orbilia oligospora]